MQRQTRLELEIGGSVRPLLFDFTFLDFLADVVSLSEIDTLATTRPWRLIPHLALAAIQSGNDFEGKKEKLDVKTVSAWVQEMEPLEANKILECYKSAMGFIGTALTGVVPVSENPNPSTGTDS